MSNDNKPKKAKKHPIKVKKINMDVLTEYTKQRMKEEAAKVPISQPEGPNYEGDMKKKKNFIKWIGTQ